MVNGHVAVLVAPFQNNVTRRHRRRYYILLFHFLLPSSHQFFIDFFVPSVHYSIKEILIVRPTSIVNNGTKQKVIRMPPTMYKRRKKEKNNPFNERFSFCHDRILNNNRFMIVITL